MTNPIDTCLADGIFGQLELSPSSFIISSSLTRSADITLNFIANQTFFESQNNIVVLVEIKDSEEQIVSDVDLEFNQSYNLRYLYQKIENGRFQFTIRASEFINSEASLSFKLKVPEFRGERKCQTVNVDCLASGFGFTYNYFKIEERRAIETQPQQPPTQPQILPPEPFVESILKAEPYYLFYLKEYENLISLQRSDARPENLNSEVISENMLPNINLLSLLNSNGKNINKYLNLEGKNRFDLFTGSFGSFSDINNLILLNMATLGGTSITNNPLEFFSKSAFSLDNRNKSNFQKFVDSINLYLNSENAYRRGRIAASLYQSYKSYVFSSQYEKINYKINNEMKEMFPMYVHLYIDNEIVKNINTVYPIGGSDSEIRAYNKKIQKKQFFLDLVLKKKFNKFLESKGLLDYFYYFLITEMYWNTNYTVPMSVIEKYFGENSITQYDQTIRQLNVVYIGDFDYILQGRYNNNIDGHIYIKSLLNDPKFIEEFLNDQVLFYRIDKWRVDDNNLNSIRNYDNGTDQNVPQAKPLQSYYFINNFDNTFLEFLDSQVKYDKQYEYRLYKYTTEFETNNDGTFKQVLIKKYFVESTITKIFDDPPVIPNVQILPYKNIDTQFLMIISPNSGRYIDYPVSIFQSDNQSINEILSSSNRNDGKVQFEGDDLIQSYEIMRLDRRPNSYGDFVNSEVKYIDAGLNGVVGVIENIEPNKKYYYTIRSKDVHDKNSNPIQPIEIELVNESGAIFLRKNYIDFNEIKPEPIKQFDKYLKIKPSKKQMQISNTERSTNDIAGLKLGPENLKVWDKNYVLRLTSKMSGKKIDIKFKFSYNLQR